MATLQGERDFYAQMFGEEMITQVDDSQTSLDDYDEAIFLFQDMLQEVLEFRPEDTSEIHFLHRSIQEAKCAKREALKRMKSRKEETAA